MNSTISDNMRCDVTYDSLKSVKDYIVLAEFIKNDIEPYLSIPLKDKMSDTVTIDTYSKKVIEKADGYVARNTDGIIVGCAIAYIRNRYENDRVYLTMLGVAHQFRGNGIAAKLLAMLCEDLPNGCKLHTNCDSNNLQALKFYQNSGFKVTGCNNGRLYLNR